MKILSVPRLPVVASFPTSASTGDLVTLATDGLPYTYTGTQWVLCAGSSATNPATILGPSAVKLWLRSDLGISPGTGTEVAGWADQSGAVNDAAESIGSQRPLLTGGVVVADGSDDRLVIPDSATLDLTSKATIGFRFRPDILSGSRAWIAKSATGGGAWSIQYSGELRFWIGVPGTAGGAAPAGSFSVGGWCSGVIVYDKDGATNADRLQIWVNGVAQTLSFYGSVPTGGITATTDALWLFAYNNAAQYAQGALKELVIADVAADAQQVSDLSALLTNGPPDVAVAGLSDYEARRRVLYLG